MSREPKDSSPTEESIYQDFQYARELFILLFQDDITFTNLGYTTRQRILTRHALAPLQEEVRVHLRPTPWAYSGDDDAGAQLSFLRSGGYNLWVHCDVHGAMKVRDTFFESEVQGTVAVIHMIPGDVDYNDIEGLVHHLLEGSGVGRTVTLKQQSFLSSLESRVLPGTATYRASWMDAETKLELVVETDVEAKESKSPSPRKEIDIWRRLPIIEYEGKNWIPFGKKPNVSGKSAQQALERQGERTTTGYFAPRPVET